MSDSTYLKPTYDDIHQACMEFVQAADRHRLRIDRIVGVQRGGLLPALILSHALNLPLSVVQYSSARGKGDDKNHSNVLPALEEKNILIVDDIVDSGHTMKEIVSHYTEIGHQCITAALFYKTHKDPIITPDFWWRSIPSNSGWVVFPFESN